MPSEQSQPEYQAEKLRLLSPCPGVCFAQATAPQPQPRACAPLVREGRVGVGVAHGDVWLWVWVWAHTGTVINHRSVGYFMYHKLPLPLVYFSWKPQFCRGTWRKI